MSSASRLGADCNLGSPSVGIVIHRAVVEGILATLIESRMANGADGRWQIGMDLLLSSGICPIGHAGLSMTGDIHPPARSRKRSTTVDLPRFYRPRASRGIIAAILSEGARRCSLA